MDNLYLSQTKQRVLASLLVLSPILGQCYQNQNIGEVQAFQAAESWITEDDTVLENSMKQEQKQQQQKQLLVQVDTTLANGYMYKANSEQVLETRVTASSAAGTENIPSAVVLLPLRIVYEVHQWGKKQHLCANKEQNDDSKGEGIQVRCQCHSSQLSTFPTINLTYGASTENSQELDKLQLLPQDYMGEPYLVDHNVFCDSLLKPVKSMQTSDDHDQDNFQKHSFYTGFGHFSSDFENLAAAMVGASITDTLMEKARLAGQEKKVQPPRKHYLTDSLLHNVGSTPQENLRDQEIFMGMIAIFLIGIYVFLLCKKRKRLVAQQDQEEKERAEVDAAALLQIQSEHSGNNSGNNSGGDQSSNNSNTFISQFTMNRGLTRETNVIQTRTSSKSSFVKKTTVSKAMGEQIKASDKVNLNRQETARPPQRFDSLLESVSQKKQNEEQKNKVADENSSYKTGHEFISSIQEEQQEFSD